MKRFAVLLMVLALLLPALALAEGPVMLVELPEDAQLLEDQPLGDGDFTQTYVLDGGVTVQLLRFTAFDMTLSDLVEAERTDYAVTGTPGFEQIGGFPAEGICLTGEENGSAVDVTIVMAHVGEQTLILQIVSPAGEQAQTVQGLLDSLGVLSESVDEEAEVG